MHTAFKLQRRNFLATCGIAAATFSPNSIAARTRNATKDCHAACDAIAKATQFLLSHKSEESLWRSDVYGPFKNETALTPRVLLALHSAARVLDKTTPAFAECNAGVQRGTQWAVDRIGQPVAYPVYFAADTLRLMSDSSSDPQRMQHVRRYLAAQQLTEAHGWKLNDPRCGGWSYAKAAPLRPNDSTAISPLAEPNLSATVAALEALNSAEKPNGKTSNKRAMSPQQRLALRFLQRLQNADGGFRFVLDDAVRNKAGARIENGDMTFNSYGSATCDGLRGLLACGLPAEHDRVVCAVQWLKQHYSATSHPGQYSESREYAREAVYYYYCRSLSQCMHSHPELLPRAWHGQLAEQLISRQQLDGSWSNDAVDVREDDPLVATPLAIMTLANSVTATRQQA